MRRPTLLAGLAIASLLLGGCSQSETGPGLADEADGALESLLASRDAQGLWAVGLVPYVAEAAAAAGKDLGAWPEPVPVAAQVRWPADETPLLQALRPLHAAALAGQDDPAALGRVRERVLGAFDGTQLGDPALLNDDAFAFVVLGAAQPAWSGLDPAIEALLANQSADGGWSWAVGGPGETDMTGLVLAGLEEAGAIDRLRAHTVLGFLDTTEADSGGHALLPGGTANCDSTVWAIRAYGSLGLSAPRSAWDFLLGLRRDDGSFAYTAGGPSNALCTAEAATLLAMAQAGEVDVPRA